jgi:hypothetical protein
VLTVQRYFCNAKFGLYPYHLVSSLAKASFARVLLRLGGRGRKTTRKKVKEGQRGRRSVEKESRVEKFFPPSKPYKSALALKFSIIKAA